ncbi:MAG: cell division protein FtsL [Terriglobia bacterium]
MATAPVILPERAKRSRTSSMRVAGRFHSPDPLFVKQIDNAHVVREVDTTKRRQCYFLLAVGALAFILVFVFALQHFECVQYGYKIASLKSQQASLTEWNQKLRLDQAQLTDPMRIDQLAREKLGLAPPEPQQVIRLGAAGTAPSGPAARILARNIGVFPVPRGTPREP